jgi:hypothetical protein
MPERRRQGRCPTCGQVPDKRAYMVWSARMQRYVRKFLSEAEWAEYDKRGSID